MSATAFVVEDRPASLPLTTLVEGLASLNVSFHRKGENLALRNSSLLTAELLAAVADHKQGLLDLADLRAGLARLFVYAVRLRCQDPPKGTRAQALAYLRAQIEKLGALSVQTGGTRDGWPDPGDPFAYDDQLAALRAAEAELKAGPYTMPLPPGCVLLPQANFDPFEYGRTYSGSVLPAIF